MWLVISILSMLSMKTAFKHPDMQEPGMACLSCLPFWKAQGLPPKILIALTKENGEEIATDGGIPIVVCPHCDGDWILRLPKE